MPYSRRDIFRFLSSLPLFQAHWLIAEQSLADEADTAIDNEAPANPTRLLPVKPGEVTFLAGRACNGKSSLAMSIALDYADADAGDVWYFCSDGRSEEIAEQFGIELRQQPPPDHRVWPDQRHFHAYKDGKHLPISFMDEWYASNRPLNNWNFWFPGLADQNPALVIYDYDEIDCTTLSNIDEDLIASDLERRRDECRHEFNAAILITMKIPSGNDLNRINKEPHISELKPQRQTARDAIANEVFFVHRPKLYSPEWSGNDLDHIEVIRASRVRHFIAHRILVRDDASKRLRDPDSNELNLMLS